MKTDAQLLSAARNDPSAFRELYERYADRVYGYYVRRTRNDEVALDLTAETFAQVWFSRTKFRDEAAGSAGPWLFAIARHVLLGSVRKRRLESDASRRLGLIDRLDRPQFDVEPEDAWLEGLDEALDDLPPAQREAIELRVLDDLDYAGVADALDTTPQAARVRVSRGLATLRRRLTTNSEVTR
jgi:RNA polymerase sigma-70 factor (ECF subfamily)